MVPLSPGAEAWPAAPAAPAAPAWPDGRRGVAHAPGAECGAGLGMEAGVAAAADVAPAEHTRFAHHSELQFARLLDFYAVAWEYEPTTFVLEWDRSGNPVQAFTPDFYLPAYDLFIEITTLNQKLVTKKNRKVRRLQELHPNVKVKVLYQRDYVGLLVKYGLQDASEIPDLVIGDTEPRPLRLTDE